MAIDAFLKLDNIDGESTDQAHPNEIEVDSFSWGATQPIAAGGGGGGTTGKVSMQDFHFTTSVNKASPKLLEACATGTHIKSATLSVRKAGGSQQDYLKIVMSDVLVSSYQPAGARDETPSEEVALNFAKIEYDYAPPRSDGSLGDLVRVVFDVAANRLG